MSCERPNVAAVYRLLLNHLKHITGSRYAPCCFIMGSRVSIPGCITFFTAIWRVFHSTKSNDFNANFSFGITAAVLSMETSSVFDVTGFKNTQASRDNRSCHFHAQLCRCTEFAAPALSRASSRRLNDTFNVMSFIRGSDFSHLFLHTQSSVLNAKTRSSEPWHYQCTHEFSRVSGHFTHCWAYRPV